jgi:hypothetical protein
MVGRPSERLSESDGFSDHEYDREFDGYAAFSRMFALQSGDGVKWDSLGVPNPDVKRSEYVVGHMSLAAKQLVLKLLQGPGVNGGGNICR